MTLQKLDKQNRYDFYVARTHETRMAILKLSKELPYTIIQILDLMRFEGWSIAKVREVDENEQERAGRANYHNSDGMGNLGVEY